MFNYRRLLKFRLSPSRPADCVAPAAGAPCGIKYNVVLCLCGEAKPTPSLAANTWSEKRSVGCSRMTSAERSEVFSARVGSALPCLSPQFAGRGTKRNGATGARARLGCDGWTPATDARSCAGCGVEWRGAASKLRSQATSPAAVCATSVSGSFGETRCGASRAVCCRSCSDEAARQRERRLL